MLDDIQEVKNQLIMLGNAAHELRNIFAQENKPSIPEILSIDQISGQQEGIARRYAARLTNPIGPGKYAKAKEFFQNTTRVTNFYLRCLSQDPQLIGYTILPINTMKKVIENIHLQQKIISYLDYSFELAYSKRKGNNNNNIQVQQNQNQQYQNYKTEMIYKELDYTKEINIQKCYEDACLTNLIDAAKQSCNKAHNIQNVICFYIPDQKVQTQAQAINKLAGTIEDSYRNILNSFGQEKDNINNIKEVIQNEIIQCEQQCQSIINISKQLENIFNKDMIFIQNLCDQILLSTFFFQEVQQLPNISLK